jgi:uncharacterized RDD family membrane protein YckC
MSKHKTGEMNLLGYYAGFSSRLLAFWIDIILVTIIVLLGAGLLAAFSTILPVPKIMEIFTNLFPGMGGGINYVIGLLSFSVVATLLYILYNLIFWALTGQTPGKALIGLRIVGKNGQQVNPLRGLLRLIGYLLGFVTLGFGFLWILVSDRRQGWHDLLAGTYVIYTWAARPDERFLAEEIADLKHHIPKVELK